MLSFEGILLLLKQFRKWDCVLLKDMQYTELRKGMQPVLCISLCTYWISVTANSVQSKKGEHVDVLGFSLFFCSSVLFKYLCSNTVASAFKWSVEPSSVTEVRDAEDQSHIRRLNAAENVLYKYCFRISVWDFHWAIDWFYLSSCCVVITQRFMALSFKSVEIKQG